LKVDEVPDSGKKIDVFQVAFGELPGQDLCLLPGGAEFIDENQALSKSLATAALDGKLVVGEILVADLDVQPRRQVLQVLKKKGVGKIGIHRAPLGLNPTGL
jgi:hypothetical protein